VKYSSEHPTVETPDLYVTCSSFPPFVWELHEKVYPNRLLATSRDLGAIGAAARLMSGGRGFHVETPDKDPDEDGPGDPDDAESKYAPEWDRAHGGDRDGLRNHCNQCGHEWDGSPNWIDCPNCGSPD
jgi:hypothetical protein